MFRNWFRKLARRNAEQTTREMETKRYRVYENGHKTKFVFDRNCDAVHCINERARSLEGHWYGYWKVIKFSAENVKLVDFCTDEVDFVWEIKEEMK